MNTEDLPSFQATNEDPTLPGAVAREPTIILTPENADARLAFPEVAEWFNEQSSNPELLPAREHARKYMWISSSLLRHIVTGDLLSPPMSSPARKSSPRQDDNLPQPQLEFWNGCYFLTLSQPPRQPSRGWTLGSLREGYSFDDLVLCLRPDNGTIYGVRRH